MPQPGIVAPAPASKPRGLYSLMYLNPRFRYRVFLDKARKRPAAQQIGNLAAPPR